MPYYMFRQKGERIYSLTASVPLSVMLLSITTQESCLRLLSTT